MIVLDIVRKLWRLAGGKRNLQKGDILPKSEIVVIWGEW